MLKSPLKKNQNYFFNKHNYAKLQKENDKDNSIKFGQWHAKLSTDTN